MKRWIYGVTINRITEHLNYIIMGVTFSLIPEYLLMQVVELLIIFAVGSVKQNLITQ